MSLIPIVVPDAPQAEPLRLGEWFVEVGQFVESGDCLTELISPGFTQDLLAPAAGTLREVLRQPERPISAGDILGWIDGEPT